MVVNRKKHSHATRQHIQNQPRANGPHVSSAALKGPQTIRQRQQPGSGIHEQQRLVHRMLEPCDLGTRVSAQAWFAQAATVLGRHGLHGAHATTACAWLFCCCCWQHRTARSVLPPNTHCTEYTALSTYCMKGTTYYICWKPCNQIH
jgi:hypothetical protein